MSKNLLVVCLYAKKPPRPRQADPQGAFFQKDGKLHAYSDVKKMPLGG